MPGRPRHVARLVVLVVSLALAAGCRDEQSGPSSQGEGKPAAPVVGTGSGDVRGVAHDGIVSWRGVPYAAPPVGDLRWRAPEPAESWDGVRDARDYGPACLQGPTGSTSLALMELGSASEDCLTLNVHRPDGADQGADLPVMVWVHGGGFVFGAGGQAAYNSPELVKRGIVLVTVNYRLGRLGFFAHPALEDSDERVANFGLLDQVRALTWVEDNIGAFGGDPDNVTVFGESAGGISVNALMASPAAAGLFDRAIAQSGFGREPAIAWDDSLVEAQAAFEPYVGATPSADDLRRLDAAQVMSVSPTAILEGQLPVLDEVVPVSVTDAFSAGEEAAVPYLTGSTDLELADDAVVPGTRAERVRGLLLGDLRATALAGYGTEQELDLRLLSDVLFGEPARHLADEHAGDAPTYRYRFAIVDGPGAAAGGAPHTAEIPFVFDDTGRQGTPIENADGLADTIADLWVDFATDGEPSGWPRAETGQILTFTAGGPVTSPDPWVARLDAVSAAYDAPGPS